MKNEVLCELLSPSVEIKSISDTIRSSRKSSRVKVGSEIEGKFNEFLKSREEIFISKAISSFSRFEVYEFIISKNMLLDCLKVGYAIDFTLRQVAEIFADESDNEIRIFVNPPTINEDDNISLEVCFTLDF